MRFSAPHSRPLRSRPTKPSTPPVLATASWFTRLPPGYLRIGISRGPLPDHIDLNTVRYQALTPIQSSKGVPPGLYHRNYLARLAALDPEFLFEDIKRMGGSRVPVLCAWISPDTIGDGRNGCHRHLAADWFERALDIKVPEIGTPPAYDRFAYWRAHPVMPSIPGQRPRTGAPPQYKISPSERAKRGFDQRRFKF